jgi:hypothetical protein
LEQISTWTLKSAHTLKEAKVIIGTLNHLCLVVPEGRAHLVALFKFCGGFKDGRYGEVRHKLPTDAANDMLWWRRRRGTTDYRTDLWGYRIELYKRPTDIADRRQRPTYSFPIYSPTPSAHLSTPSEHLGDASEHFGSRLCLFSWSQNPHVLVTNKQLRLRH